MARWGGRLTASRADELATLGHSLTGPRAHHPSSTCSTRPRPVGAKPPVAAHRLNRRLMTLSAPGPDASARPVRDPALDPFDPARRLERLLWDATGLLDDAHHAALLDRPIAGPEALTDRLKALALVVKRAAVVSADAGLGPQREGDLARLLDSETPLLCSSAASTAPQTVETAGLLVDQAAQTLQIALSLIDAAVTTLSSASSVDALTLPAPTPWVLPDPAAGAVVEVGPDEVARLLVGPALPRPWSDPREFATTSVLTAEQTRAAWVQDVVDSAIPA